MDLNVGVQGVSVVWSNGRMGVPFNSMCVEWTAHSVNLRCRLLQVMQTRVYGQASVLTMFMGLMAFREYMDR